MTETELPPGWVRTSLGEIVRPRAERRIPEDGVETPYLGMDGVERDTGKIVRLGKATGIRSASPIVYAGDTLYGRLRPYLNKVVTSSFNGYCSGEFIVLPRSSLIADKFFQYRLLAPDFHEFVSNLNHGDRPRVKWKNISSFSLNLPPLAEQKRVVDALEGHLSRLDAAVSNVYRCVKAIPMLRGAVRTSLTLNGSSADLPDGWRRGRLAEVIEEIQAGKSFRCEPRSSRADEWGVIKTSAMTWGVFRPEENKAVPDGRAIDSRHEIKHGDVLISRANTREYVGAPVLVDSPPPRLLLSDKSLRVVPKPYVDREWLIHTLSSPHIREQISAKATGTKESMRNISQNVLKNVEIVIPPGEIMAEIGSVNAAALSRAEQLHAGLGRTRRRSAALRRSLLNHAFSGKLVPQDPDDEPASVLLERIRAQREAQPVPKRQRRAKKMTKSANAGSTPEFERPAPPVSSEPGGRYVQEELWK